MVSLIENWISRERIIRIRQFAKKFRNLRWICHKTKISTFFNPYKITPFISIEEMVSWTLDWIKKFPEQYDIIIGIPRSGLVIANIIALKLGQPLTTPDLYVNNQTLGGAIIKKQYKNALLVDDTVDTGRQMKMNFKLLSSHFPGLNITKAALLPHSISKKRVHLYYKVIDRPRLTEWELLTNKKVSYIGFDMDGVICEDCPNEVDNYDNKYLKWIKNARPYLIPNYEIDMIVSNRLEKFRQVTEHWLNRHGVKYKKLILWDLKSKQERNGKFAEHKIGVLSKEKLDLFVESNPRQAKQIWKQTKIPTISIRDNIIYQ